MLITGCPSRLACAAQAMKNDSAMRARTGKPREENTGAAVNTASTRRKGHRMGDTQATNWASLKVNTACARLVGYTTDAGIAWMVRMMYSTSMFSIHGPAIANTAMAAISLGTKASVASWI